MPAQNDEHLSESVVCRRLGIPAVRLHYALTWGGVEWLLTNDEIRFSRRSLEARVRTGHVPRGVFRGVPYDEPCMGTPLTMTAWCRANTAWSVQFAQRRASRAWQRTGRPSRDPASFTRVEYAAFLPRWADETPCAINGERLIALSEAGRLLGWSRGRVLDGIARGVLYGEVYDNRYLLREPLVRRFDALRRMSGYGTGPTLRGDERFKAEAVMQAVPARRVAEVRGYERVDPPTVVSEDWRQFYRTMVEDQPCRLRHRSSAIAGGA
jgi:hypothetical protein